MKLFTIGFPCKHWILYACCPRSLPKQWWGLLVTVGTRRKLGQVSSRSGLWDCYCQQSHKPLQDETRPDFFPFLNWRVVKPKSGVCVVNNTWVILSDHCSNTGPFIFRSSPDKKLKIPHYYLRSYGYRSLSVSAPSLWNSLDCFKEQLKTYLFRQAYANLL